jgi:hypothetical protein
MQQGSQSSGVLLKSQLHRTCSCQSKLRVSNVTLTVPLRVNIFCSGLSDNVPHLWSRSVSSEDIFTQHVVNKNTPTFSNMAVDWLLCTVRIWILSKKTLPYPLMNCYVYQKLEILSQKENTSAFSQMRSTSKPSSEAHDTCQRCCWKRHRPPQRPHAVERTGPNNSTVFYMALSLNCI